ncbi:hypothetical protein PHISP_00397 [Aspergillus sp. HF37]|nr:hypothetical protein PHISP_00397 [Aspergillus sp. HF37]
METAAVAGRIDHGASESSPLEAGSVRDKVGRFTDNSHAAKSGNGTDKDSRDGTLPPSRKSSHDHNPVEDNSQKPPIPRKPVMLGSTKPPDPTEPPTKRHVAPAPPQKHPQLINELMGSHGGVRSPGRDRPNDKYSLSHSPSVGSNQASPLSDDSKPRLPPRTGTYSSDQSSSPRTPASSKQSLPLHIGRKPGLPPRRDGLPISRSATDRPGILLEDNDPPSRSLKKSSTTLLDEPSIMAEKGPKSAGPVRASSLNLHREAPARKVPPPPPRQRRAGPPTTSPQKESCRANTYTAQKTVRQTQGGPAIPNKQDNRMGSKNKISENEQKRYEAVWAANKGLLIPGPNEPFFEMYPPGASEMVLNLVVRDIWSRSCLSNDILQQIWDLVGRQNVRLLTKDEFVVGMWLIDQKLEGSQLPVSVPDSVWNSTRRSPTVDLL